MRVSVILPAMSALTESPAFVALRKHKESLGSTHMRELFAKEPTRFADMSQEACGLFVDYSKHIATKETLSLLFALSLIHI